MAPRERAASAGGVAPAAEVQHINVQSRRKYGVYCAGLVLTLVVLILIVLIIMTLLLVEGKNAAIILPVLLVLLVGVSIAAFVLIRWQHTKAVERRNESAQQWIHRTVSEQQLAQQQQRQNPSFRSSWAFWRKQSSGSTQPIPTAPSISTNTSVSNAPPGYSSVATTAV